MGGETQLMHTQVPEPAIVRVINAMTVDVEDYFQVSAFEAHVDKDAMANLAPDGWRTIRFESSIYLLRTVCGQRFLPWVG